MLGEFPPMMGQMPMPPVFGPGKYQRMPYNDAGMPPPNAFMNPFYNRPPPVLSGGPSYHPHDLPEPRKREADSHERVSLFLFLKKRKINF